MILVINCGSSSVKFALFNGGNDTSVHGVVELIGGHKAEASYVYQGIKHQVILDGSKYNDAFSFIKSCFTELNIDPATLDAVGHRVVHGGDKFQQAVIIDHEIIAEIFRLSDLAPLHNPSTLLGINAAKEMFPGVPHVAVFDTAFHQTMPSCAYTYATPFSWYEDNAVRKYGFHGTSHQYVAEQAAEKLERPLTELCLVTAHLGNGCSAAAIKHGESIDTTMGFTPLDGLVMGSRSGDVDANIIAYIAKQRDLTLEEVIDDLHQHSGLLGLSGISHDMRTLLEHAEQGRARAQLAIDVFCYRLSKTVGALAVALDGFDAIVFTGGIGEHAAPIRAQVIKQLRLFGLQLDPHANGDHGRQNHGLITTSKQPAALVIPTNEALKIADETRKAIA